jgi:hypothetical protein
MPLSPRVALTLMLTLSCIGCAPNDQQAGDSSPQQQPSCNPGSPFASSCAVPPGQVNVQIHGMVQYDVGSAGID